MEVVVDQDKKTVDNSIELKLLQLKDLTARFECVDELQLAQLKLWPFAVDPDLDNNLICIDFPTKLVKYTWTKAKHKPDKNYNKRLKELYSKVRWLLGDLWKLQILCNGKTIFSSVTNVAQRTKCRTNSDRIRKQKRGKAKR